MRILFFALLFLPGAAIAQTPNKTTAPPGTFVPAMNSSLAPSPTPAPSDEGGPSPFKISYFGEYQGPVLGNISIGRTQYPGGQEGYTEWDHSLKVGYAVSKNVTIGTQFRAASPTDPNASFAFADQRIYAQWSHMIVTSDVDIAGKLVAELPTTDASRNAGKLIAFKIDANVELKTALRNWDFSFTVEAKPYFYNDPTKAGAGQTDLEVGLFPYVTLDMSPNVQLLFEGSFDAAHNFNDDQFNFNSDYNDYVDIGPLFTVNSHINTNVALRFFTDNISFKAAAIYVNLGVAL